MNRKFTGVCCAFHLFGVDKINYLSWIGTDVTNSFFPNQVTGVESKLRSSITYNHPVLAHLHRFAYSKTKSVEDKFGHMFPLDITRYLAMKGPLHYICTAPKKTTGDWCTYGDYKMLNSGTVSDKCSIWYIHDFASSLHCVIIFSKIELIRTYDQIHVEPCDIHEAVTHFELSEFLRMPFGLWNTVNCFQRFVEEVTRLSLIMMNYFKQSSHIRT